MFRGRRLACSFCGRGEGDVVKLVAGPKVYICDHCVALASKIMEEHSADEPRPPERPLGLLQRVWNRIARAGYRDWPWSSECHGVAR